MLKKEYLDKMSTCTKMELVKNIYINHKKSIKVIHAYSKRCDYR